MHRNENKQHKIITYKSKKMKNAVLTLGIIAVLATSLSAQNRIQRFTFKASDGSLLELFVETEEEVNEPLPVDTFEIFKNLQKEKLVGFDGEVFDLDSISEPEQDIIETQINTKAIFDQYINETQYTSAK